MTMDLSPEGLSRMAAQGLRLEPPPTEGEIDEILLRLASVFGVSADVISSARRHLHAQFSIRMEVGQTLRLEEHTPWLDARRAQIDPFYWNRYQQYLLRRDWSPLVVTTLGRSVDELLDLLGNPVEPGEWKRRGLVVGDVQSGKTASYAGLICKAADAGYAMVILLTGTLENVRRQTQERLDAAFVGLDSRDFLARDQLRHKTHVGVGLIDSRRDGIVFTSRDNDFRKSTATALNLSLEAVREPVLVVTKKNKRVLNSLAAWLRTRNADRDGRIDVPLLLIDDEADNASINTRQMAGETTAINAAIRDLLSLFKRSSYVGFTATPFANIFIDPISDHEMLGDDLFPRDFIHLLEPPTNYIGMNDLFPPVDPEDVSAADEHGLLAGLRTIDDADAWLPADHKQDAVPGQMPETLLRAIRLFLIASAIRDLWAKSDGESNIHRSMLINVSRFTAVQNAVAGDVQIQLDAIRQQVRLYGKLPPAQAEESAEIRELKTCFSLEFRSCGLEWAQVLATLHEAISPIRVQPVNQSTGAASLDYSAIDAPPGLRVIAVGGNSLSRGLTLEGLCVSYFLRNAKAYDTLLQMGRWFGYRDGYRDVCRLFLSEDAEGWYRHVTEATNELKRDFARMRRQRASPAEFGLRVRTHPDTLLITARNKMATGIDVVDHVRDISLAGRGIETSRLYADRRRNEDNFATLERFFAALMQNVGAPIPSPTGNAVLWRNVPAQLVIGLLEAFLVHPFNHDFQGDAIASFLKDAVERGDALLSQWSVALPNRGRGGPTTISSLPSVSIISKERRVLVRNAPPRSLLVSGKGARVGSRQDVEHAFGSDEVRSILERERASNPSIKDVPEDVLRESMPHPLLLTYLLQGFERDAKDAPPRDYESGLILPALGMHFPGKEDENAPKQYVRYRLNRVAQAELEFDEDDAQDEPDED